MTEQEAQKVMQMYNNLLLGFGLSEKQLKDLAEVNRIVLEEFSTIENLPVQEKML